MVSVTKKSANFFPVRDDSVLDSVPSTEVNVKHQIQYKHYDITIQMCSGITPGRVLNGVLYAQRFQKVIYLHLFTDYFMKIFLQSSEQKP